MSSSCGSTMRSYTLSLELQLRKTLLRNKFYWKVLLFSRRLASGKVFNEEISKSSCSEFNKASPEPFFYKQLVSACSYFSLVQEITFTDLIIFIQYYLYFHEKKSSIKSKGLCCEHFRWSLQILSGVLRLAPKGKPAWVGSCLNTDHSFQCAFCPYAFYLTPISSQYDLYDYIIPNGYCRCFPSE